MSGAPISLLWTLVIIVVIIIIIIVLIHVVFAILSIAPYAFAHIETHSIIQQKEIILSISGQPQQQIYLNEIIKLN